MQGTSPVQRTTIRDVSDPTAIWMSHFSVTMFSNSSSLNLSKCPLLGDGDLLVARELELGPAEGFNHMLLVLQLGAGRLEFESWLQRFLAVKNVGKLRNLRVGLPSSPS